MIPIGSYPVKIPTMVGMELDNEAVVMVPDRGKVSVLNEVGARIWSLVDCNKSVGDIVAIICNEYQVEAHEARSDACLFIEQLIERGILTISNFPTPTNPETV